MFKATNISTPEQIHLSCSEMQSFIEAHYNADNPSAVVERANVLESYMALSGKLLADAKYNYNEILNSVFVEAVKQGNSSKMQTSTLNKYIDSLCRDYQYLVDWCGRINAAVTHELDFSRTILSKLKAEIISYGSNR